MMDYNKFRDLVRRMRVEQISYFRSRRQQSLRDAKLLEAEVDAELKPGFVEFQRDLFSDVSSDE